LYKTKIIFAFIGLGLVSGITVAALAATQPKLFVVTSVPTALPTRNPITYRPTRFPTTRNPSKSPTGAPTIPTNSPSFLPTKNPTLKPTINPTKNPTTNPSRAPSKNPTTNPTPAPSKNPTRKPTNNPTKSPTIPFIAYINEFTVRGTGSPSANDDRIEIVYHTSIDLSKLALSVYHDNGLDMILATGFTNTFPQFLNSTGWIISTSSYCNGNLKIAYKFFGENVLDHSGFSMGLTYDSVIIPAQFFGNTANLIAINGPFDTSSTEIFVSNNQVPSVITPNGTSNALIGSGNKYSDFTFSSAFNATIGHQNNGQTFC